MSSTESSKKKSVLLFKGNGSSEPVAKVVAVGCFSDVDWNTDCEFSDYIDAVKNYPQVDSQNKAGTLQKKMGAIDALDVFFKPSFDTYFFFEKIKHLVVQRYSSLTSNPGSGRSEARLSRGFLLVGIHGVGKKTLLNHVLNFFPKAIVLKSYDCSQLPQNSHLFGCSSSGVVSSQCWITSLNVHLTIGATVKDIYFLIFEEVDSIVHTKYATRYAGESRISKLSSICKKIFQQYYIGLVIFHDCHKVSKSDDVLDLVTVFSFKYKVPQIVVTTPEYLSSQQSLQQFAEMSSSALIPVERMVCVKSDFIENREVVGSFPDNDFFDFMRRISSFQWNRVGFDLSMPDFEAFYRSTAGIKGLCVKLYKNIQIRLAENESYNEQIRNAFKNAKVPVPPSKLRKDKFDSSLVYEVADECFSALKESISKMVAHDFSLRGNDLYLRADIDMSMITELSFDPKKGLFSDAIAQESCFNLSQYRLNKKNDIYNLLKAYFADMSEPEILAVAEFVALNSPSDKADEWICMAKDRVAESKGSNKSDSFGSHMPEVDLNLWGMELTVFRDIFDENATPDEMYREMKRNRRILNLESLSYAE